MLEYNEHSNAIAKFENKVVMLHNTLQYFEIHPLIINTIHYRGHL